MQTLILQSCSREAPEWIADCCHQTEAWANERGFDYKLMNDELFSMLPICALGYSRATQSDLGRLQWIAYFLRTGKYRSVYWIDSDFLIWDRAKFSLPSVASGSVVCAREAWFLETGGARLAINNSICGLACENDAEMLAEITADVLCQNHGRASWHTMAGTDIFSAATFPLTRIYAKHAGCFSEESVARILGPFHDGRKHLQQLSLASGATLYGANLAASRGISEEMMSRLIVNLITHPHLEAGPIVKAAPVFRAWLRARHLMVRFQRSACRRLRLLRTLSSGKA